MVRLSKICMVLVVCLITFGLSQTAFAKATTPMIETGVLDLRDWDFSPGRVMLSGNWQVVWEDFADPRTFFEVEGHGTISIPDDWGRSSSDGRPFETTGFATYGLKIKLPDHEHWVDITMIEEGVKIGDYLLSYQEAAINKISPHQAKEVFKLLKQTDE